MALGITLSSSLVILEIFCNLMLLLQISLTWYVFLTLQILQILETLHIFSNIAVRLAVMDILNFVKFQSLRKLGSQKLSLLFTMYFSQACLSVPRICTSALYLGYIPQSK